MKYILVIEYDAFELVEIVMRQIQKGYKPLGGVAVTIDRQGRSYFAQAMILE